jgi:SAM-dependent methyltransferase
MYARLESTDNYYPTRKWEYDAALADLRGRQRILEIGCGSGNFMVLAKAEGGLCIEGLEQNRKAIGEAQQRGLTVREATAEEAAKETAGAYDAVCTFQVLEHIAKPKEFLDACCALLKPGGTLIVAVPNQDSYLPLMIQPLDTPPHHMTRWTQKSLRGLQDHFPLRLVRTACEPLAQDQIEWYLSVHAGALRRRKLGFLAHPAIFRQIYNLIRFRGLLRFLKGQNMYACYVRRDA